MADSTTSTAPTVGAGYKGKALRSWPDLPSDLLRSVADYILYSAGNPPVPSGWNAAPFRDSRRAFIYLRNAHILRNYMRVCRAWHRAFETLPFWYWAIQMLDPAEFFTRALLPQGANAPRPSPFQHFQHVFSASCAVCRVNYAHTAHGVGAARRRAPTAALGPVSVCREHRARHFCALCLRVEHNYVPGAGPRPNLADNDDPETFGGVDATCEPCREDALASRAARDPRVAAARAARTGARADWDVRAACDAFVELGEGSLAEIAALAAERAWLAAHTKLPALLAQALAASRLADREARAHARAEGALEEWESEDDVLEDEDEDADVVASFEDAHGVADLALQDYCRQRIMDGHWLAPADAFYRAPGVPPPAGPAAHPMPWREPPSPPGAPEPHPHPALVLAEAPPTYALAERVCAVHGRVLRGVLRPALDNLVRRIAIEAAADGADAAVRAGRVRPEDVVAMLREPAAWTRGVDWLARRAARRGAEEDALSTRASESGSSEGSAGGSVTSPVLSTSTLRTTPSPEPAKDASSPAAPAARVLAHALEPAREVSVPMATIPYVPVDIAHFPDYTRHCLQTLWREACAPLYTCHCAICARALLAQGGAPAPMLAVPLAPAAEIAVPRARQQTPGPDRRARAAREEEEEGEEEELEELEGEDDGSAVDVEFEDVLAEQPEEDDPPVAIIDLTGSDADADAHADADADAYTNVTDDASATGDNEVATLWAALHTLAAEGDDAAAERAIAKLAELGGTPATTSPRTRKRALDDETRSAGGRGTTPPKRAKTGPATPARTPERAPSPARRKRSSEELEDDFPSPDAKPAGPAHVKRKRTASEDGRATHDAPAPRHPVPTSASAPPAVPPP